MALDPRPPDQRHRPLDERQAARGKLRGPDLRHVGTVSGRSEIVFHDRSGYWRPDAARPDDLPLDSAPVPGGSRKFPFLPRSSDDRDIPVPFAFKFKHQIVAAQLDAPADFLKRFARESRRVPPDSLLRWQTGAGISGPVVLKSGSGHTNFVADGDVIRGQTRYATDDYQEPAAWETRGAYSRQRLQALFQIIEQAGGVPMMLAVTHVAACPIAKADGASVRQQIALVLESLTSRTVGRPLGTLLCVSGRPVGNDCFLNVQVAWYPDPIFHDRSQARPANHYT